MSAWSEQRTVTEPVAGPDRLTKGAIAAILIGTILLNRFGLDMPGGGSIALSLPITLGALALLLVCGRVEVNIGRLVLYMVAVATLALVTTLGPKMFSPNSFALLLVLYACFVFQLAPNRIDYLDILRLYQNLVLICVVAGILQFVLQFVLPLGPTLFAFDEFVPDLFLMDGFNTVIPLRWDSPYYKSNGFFILEPSGFSQLAAIAVVIELLFFERVRRLALYGIGLLLSYSGTGLLLLVWALPAIFLLRRQYWLIWVGLLALVLLAVFGEALRIDIFADRMDEFTSRRSSAFNRFVAPWLLLGDHIISDPGSFLFGKGPGSYIDYTRGRFATAVVYEPHDPTWAKLLLEYGLIGLVTFGTFVLYCFFAAAPSRFLAFALLFGYLTFGGMLLNIHYHALLVALLILPVREGESWFAVRPEPAAAPGRSPQGAELAAFRGAQQAPQPPGPRG